MMKIFLFVGLVLVLASDVAGAKCLNKRHSMPNNKQAYEYQCAIRGDDTGRFTTAGFCKLCGCSQRVHDNRS